MDPVAAIQERIAHAFRDTSLLERALTHKSYANEHRVPFHNERLEFLGDAVLNLLVSEFLMNKCPDSSEGDLSKLRAAVVSEPSLAAVARLIGLGGYILLGRGEEQSGGRDKDSLLSDGLEALIASIYLDGGQQTASAFISRFFEPLIEKTCSSGGIVDHKTKLQELCQERLRQLPEYRVASESGPDHQKQFEVEILIKGQSCGRGVGRSKKEAEQKAAKEALEKMR